MKTHLMEIAEESGIDLVEESATSNENEVRLPGLPPIVTFYQEAATWRPWKAFLAGVGTYSHWSAEEAAGLVAEKARERLARGGLVGESYLAGIRR